MAENSKHTTDVSHVLSKDDDSFETRWFDAPDHLSHAIEAMWIFDWNCREHIAKLIPEPSVHLILEGAWSRVVGPSTKPFQRTVFGSGRMVGFKCRIGAFRSVLDVDVSTIAGWQIPLIQAGFDIGSVSDVNSHELLWDFIATQISPNTSDVSRAMALAEFIEQAPDSTVDELAKHFSMTPRSVQRTFKHYIGVSPKSVAMRYRMREAVVDLKQGVNVVDVSHKNGFFDQAHFTKTFRKATGATPDAFRKTHEDRSD